MTFRAIFMSMLLVVILAHSSHAEGSPGSFPEDEGEADRFCWDVVREKHKVSNGPVPSLPLKLGMYQTWTSCLDEVQPIWRKPEIKNYEIDSLTIEVRTLNNPYTANCHTGGLNFIKLKGPIGPDSSFAISELLSRLEPCRDIEGTIVSPITMDLDSGGGYLTHGFELGRALRSHQVRTVVSSHGECASACAVAFLGGVYREVAEGGRLTFHAPYILARSSTGKMYPDCEVPEEVLSDFKKYYVEMTADESASQRLYERTMLNCSTASGWVITGHDGAELFGVATDLFRSPSLKREANSPLFNEAKDRNSRFFDQ